MSYVYVEKNTVAWGRIQFGTARSEFIPPKRVLFIRGVLWKLLYQIELCYHLSVVFGWHTPIYILNMIDYGIFFSCVYVVGTFIPNFFPDVAVCYYYSEKSVHIKVFLLNQEYYNIWQIYMYEAVYVFLVLLLFISFSRWWCVYKSFYYSSFLPFY